MKKTSRQTVVDDTNLVISTSDDNGEQEARSRISVTTATVRITPPNFEVAEFRVTGITPYVQLKFSEKAKATLRADHEGGTTKLGKKNRKARDFEKDYEQCTYLGTKGQYGIPASGVRKAMISACRTVDFKMTHAKLSIFIEEDDTDKESGTGLINIEGKPEMSIMPVRNSNGSTDLRVRAMWRKWGARIRVRYDADMFTRTDITNLLARAGLQVGIGEGRPDSKMSAGMGWGQFVIHGKQ